jgi:ABC-2 type transport system ATP-binding protein
VYPGGRAALAGISFTVDRGEVFGFLGPNGSGKTTTVRILVTLLRKTSGVARVSGFDTDREPRRVREVIGYAAQGTGVDDDLTAHENLMLTGLLHGLPAREVAERAEELLDALSLAEVAGERAGRFSGGMRRRLDLAQALVHRPPVLFLDEPTAGLDPQSRNALWELLRALNRQGTTVWC